MISVVIITAGIIYVAHSFNASKNSCQRSQEILMSSLLLDDRMWEYEQSGEIAGGVSGGDFSAAPGYGWEVEADKAEDEEVFLVRAKVFRKDDPKKSAHSIETYLREKEE